MAITLFSAFMLVNALLLMAMLLLALVRKMAARMPRPLSYRQQLRLGYVLLIAALGAPWVALSSKGEHFMPMTTQVWSAPSMRALDATVEVRDTMAISAVGLDASVPADFLSHVLLALFAAGLGLTMARIWSGAMATRRIVQNGHLLRRSGTLRILATEDSLVPFSCWIPGASCIVVPAGLLLRPTDFRIALRHEGQHHRHGDTRVIYALELLRGLFFLNPATHGLLRQLQALQEFACDEALVRRGRVTPQGYCDCLLSVAHEAARARSRPAWLPITGRGSAKLLLRRIHAVLETPRQHLQRARALAMHAVAALAILATGIVLTGSIHDRRVSLAQAQSMAAVARAGSHLPIAINGQVLAELNRFVGTPDGRRFVRSALLRMSEHEPMIAGLLRQHGLPAELVVVPLVESGYQNLAQGPDARHGAGIWMFIEPTARRFGLEIESGRDQRLDVALETRAALQMFASLHAEFDDWGFALLAYNGGAELVRRAIRETGATDAFSAVRHGYENDSRYMARITAALIVLKNLRRLGLDR